MTRIMLSLCAALAAAACSGPAETPAGGETAPARAPAPIPAPAPPVPPALAAEPSPAPSPDLAAWLTRYVEDASGPIRYVAREVGEGHQAMTLVYLIGRDYCGSGGCRLLILRHQGAEYETLGRLSIVNTPVRLLTTETNGRPDLGVRVAGGGVQAHEALIPFDGRRYASNPSVPPAREVQDAEGETLITNDDRGLVLKE